MRSTLTIIISYRSPRRRPAIVGKRWLVGLAVSVWIAVRIATVTVRWGGTTPFTTQAARLAGQSTRYVRLERVGRTRAAALEQQQPTDDDAKHDDDGQQYSDKPALTTHLLDVSAPSTTGSLSGRTARQTGSSAARWWPAVGWRHG